MFILNYNRKLAWVAIPAVLWALVGLSLALGISSPAANGPRAGLRLGVPEGGLHLRGHVASLTEADGQLHIVLAVPGPLLPQLPELPEDLRIEVLADRGLMRARPRIELGSGSQLRELPGGRFAVATGSRILLFGHGDLRIVRRPPDLADDRLYEWLERQHRRNEPPPPEDRPRPPEGRRPPRR